MQLQIVPYVEVQKMSLEIDQTSDTRLWMGFDIEQKSRCRTSSEVLYFFVEFL